MANNVPQVLELFEFKTELQPDEGRYQGACRRLHRINTGVGVEREQRDDAAKPATTARCPQWMAVAEVTILFESSQ